ncbi:MAG TPA: hypothetical protein VM677_29250 [Actinokineospora sp.]|nr:hypothetical protein [Actinokineospora sp.]
MSVTINGEALLVRPGDTLIVTMIGTGITLEMAEKVKAALREELPGVAVLVISGTVQIGAYRPDDVTTESSGHTPR